MTAVVWPVLFALGSLLGAAPPYEARVVTSTAAAGNTRVQGLVSADLDADGTKEVVVGVATGVILGAWRAGEARIINQVNFPPRFVGDEGTVRLGLAFDQDGDGREEIFATANDRSGRDQRLWLLDAATATWQLDVPLPSGPDLREDGRWDGAYLCLGLIPDAEPAVVVLARSVQYDRISRGVLGLDARSGEELWFLPTAGNVARAACGDLDGDGRQEIAVSVGSAGNLRPGEEVRGRRDDQGRVIALDAQGQIRWEQTVSSLFDNPHVAVSDLDADGIAEVIVATQCVSEGFENHLSVFDGATGGVLAKVTLGSVCRGLQAWQNDAAGAGAIVCVLDDSRCVRYRYAGGMLAVDREARLSAPAGTVFAADFLPEPGPEFLISAVDGSMRLLGADLALLARLPDWSAPSPGAGIWDLGRESVMLYPSRSGLGYRLVATPLHRRYAGPAGAGIVLLGTGVLGGTLVRQRRRLGRLRHTSRRDLLHAFLTSSHGTVGPVAALERALWSLENAAPAADGARPPLDAWERCRREAVPELETLLEKADHVRIDPPLQSIVRRELGNVGRIFDELAAGDVRAERRPGLIVAGRVSLGLVADGMKSLGATLAASCVLDPAPLVRELLARHSARNPAVVFVLHEDPEAPVRACHADTADLAFIVDNLLDNAVRQVSGAADPAVTASLCADSGRVYLSVTDNGPGVPAADRERIFAAGVSTRDGGGLGLWHSREAVRYYGGDLTVAEAPGGGASFLLSLRAAMA